MSRKPRVLNRKTHGLPKGSVYVGRPSKWGNPWSHQSGTTAEHRAATRDEAVERFAAWLHSQPDLEAAARVELRGKDLVCWCAPAKCHADVLLLVANTAEP